ncbi:MAG: response regulator transcription factor, partial [Chloroflexi bacterium]|nr:response regulator transcription factor [Chloroflexota bacterium]
LRHETVLIADDDPTGAAVVSRILEIEGFNVLATHSGAAVLLRFEELRPDLVILDVRMPDMDGFAVCRALRRTSRVPIIMLTAVDDEASAARAFDAGADDYVRKPFGAAELAARVKAILRRADMNDRDGGQIVAGPLVVDEIQHIATLDGREINLSRIEFRLLAYLVRHPNRVVTHDDILTRVWGLRYVGSHHVLRVAMSRLRQRLAIDGRDDVTIQTIGGVGYRFLVTDAVRVAV